jgi:glycosyltransferase involved in cell wall biosynthesis
MKLTVIVTVYNEKNTIIKAIEEAKSLDFGKEVIVVDNCSNDGTAEILKELRDDSIKIIFQPENYGFGQSVLTGASIANGEFIFIQYADLEYDIGGVYAMVDLMEKENLDAVFGSRLYGLKKTPGSILSLIKKRPYSLGTLITTSLINCFYRKKFTDIIGTKLYRTSSFRKIHIKSQGVGFDFELISLLCKNNFLIKEVPVTYKARGSKEGKKIKARHIFPALSKILKVKFFK